MNNILRQEGTVASQPYVLGRFSRKTGRFLQLSKKHIQEFSKSIYVLDNIRFFRMLNALVENLNANNDEMSRSYRGY